MSAGLEPAEDHSLAPVSLTVVEPAPEQSALVPADPRERDEAMTHRSKVAPVGRPRVEDRTDSARPALWPDPVLVRSTHEKPAQAPDLGIGGIGGLAVLPDQLLPTPPREPVPPVSEPEAAEPGQSVPVPVPVESELPGAIADATTGTRHGAPAGAGTSDTGTGDTGTGDTETSDIGTSDSETSDIGTSDIGTSDSGTSGTAGDPVDWMSEADPSNGAEPAPQQPAPPLTRAARRELERAAAAASPRPGTQRWVAVLGVVVGFAALQMGMWAVVTDQLARVVGWVSLVVGGYLVDRAWRTLLTGRPTADAPAAPPPTDHVTAPSDLRGRLRWAAVRMPWVPIAAVAVGWLLARLRGTG